MNDYKDEDEGDWYEERKIEERQDREDAKRMSKGYFIREDNSVVFFDDIANAIRTLHPELVGKHIFQQLEALGLSETFNRGRTPVSLPYSFTEVW